MSGQQAQALEMFIVYKAVDGKRVPVKVVAAPSKHQAQKSVESMGLVSLVAANEAEDAGDLVRLLLPDMLLMLTNLAQLLAIVAQDANERIQERAKRGLGLVRGN